MRLLSNADAALAIGAKNGGVAPSEEDTQMAGVIAAVLPKLEEALNVKSLVSTAWVDYFRLSLRPEVEGDPIRLRLGNGFIDNNVAVTVVNPDGSTLDLGVDDRDDEYGIVNIPSSVLGLYKVKYTSGFKPTPYVAPDPLPDGYTPPLAATFPVLQNVPEWMKTAITAYIVQWYRIEVLGAKLPGKAEGRSAQMLADAIRTEILTRAYSRYMRPRVGVQWSEKTVLDLPSA